MKKFVLKTALLSFIIATTFLILISFDFLIVGNQYVNNYQAATIDKMHRLQDIDSPKIILVGNSNVAFGINSEKIENEFNMPVVNLGLHGALGNAFHENMIKGYVSEGDIVIICHCDYSDEDIIEDPGLAWITIEKNFDIWNLIRFKDIPSMVKAYPRYAMKCASMWLKGTGNEESDSSYSRSAFNKYGDIVYKPDYDFEYTMEEFSDGVNPPEINDICINRLNDLNIYIENHGGKMLIAAYPIGYGEYTADKEEFILFQNDLEEQLDCEIISNYTDYFIPYKYFYNSKMHLTDEGTEIRTQQLIEDIYSSGVLLNIEHDL